MLREAEVRLSQGAIIGLLCRELGISDQSYYRWPRDYGGLKVDQVDQVKTLKNLKRENYRLKGAASKFKLDAEVPKEALEGTAGQSSKNTEPFPHASVPQVRALLHGDLRAPLMPDRRPVANFPLS